MKGMMGLIWKCERGRTHPELSGNAAVSPGAKSKGARVRIANEHRRPARARVEVEPLLSLRPSSPLSALVLAIPILCSGGPETLLAFGCQCNSLNPEGRNLTNVAAIVCEIGKFVESILCNSPPPPGTFSPANVSVLCTNDALAPFCTACPPPLTARSPSVPKLVLRMKGFGEGVIEHSRVDAEVLGEDRSGSVANPAVDIERRAHAVKVRLVKPGRERRNFSEMGIVWTLRYMWRATYTKRNSFSLSIPCTACAMPLGKYQMSPKFNCSVWKPPFSSTTDTVTEPLLKTLSASQGYSQNGSPALDRARLLSRDPSQEGPQYWAYRCSVQNH